MKHAKFSIVCFLALFLLIAVNPLSAQKIFQAEGKSQVRMENNMTTEDVYAQAEQQAKINAIEKEFGTYVEQQTDMTLSDGRISYNIIGTTKVKGDWIKTSSIKFSEDLRLETGAYGKQNVKYITCNIKGKVRKSAPKANIDFKILNCPDEACRTTDFVDGEQLYLYFQSPVDGYLSVYVDEGDITYRLLPYVLMSDDFQSGVFVESDTEYLFFTEKYNSFKSSVVDEIVMFTTKNVEYNTIYIVFAEEKFVKPILEKKEEIDGRILPKSLSSEEFQSWLSENKAILDSFQDRKIKINIKPN
jgi:hypothetical protein